MARPKPLPAPRVGDLVRVKAPGTKHDGLSGRVIGLRVLSCDGRVGTAVQYSARGYAVVNPRDIERAA